MSFVTLRITDKEGLTVPRTNNLVHFSITGPGEIVATDNGDATDLTSFQTADRKAFNGLALVIVKAKRGERGTITLTATSEGMKSASATIKLK